MKRLARDQRGNALILTAAALVPIIAIVGSAVDIGRGYMAQLRLQQACDAGVLAGRRSMAAGTYGDTAKAEATKMFNFNYPGNMYGSTDVVFTTQKLTGTTDVSGTATARVPTAIMYIFGTSRFNLVVNCSAKLEISNTDVMLVLDVTGSMEEKTSDGKTRMLAMQNAAKLFFTTMTSTNVGDGRLRFGMVPYASTVNVGEILRAKNPAWLSDYTLLPSRSPITKLTWTGTSAPAAVTGGTTADSAWTNIIPISGFTNSTDCSALSPPADSAPTATATPGMNRTARLVDPSDTRVYSDDTGKIHYYYNYRYTYTSSKCWLQQRKRTYTQTTAAAKPSLAFRNQYRYEDRLFDVSALKTAGGEITVDTGSSGTNKTYKWSGCIVERQTSPFASTASPPAEALDMDVDTVPTADEATKWRMYIPEITYPRAISYNNSVPYFAVDSKNSSRGIAAVDKQVLTVNSSFVSADGTKEGNWMPYPSYWSQGGGVCPAAAKNMTEMTAADQTTFDEDWIDKLEPLGGTYHDAGMAWGIRLLSPVGLFAAENTYVKNERPIYRHIIFMTDGEMAPSMRNFSTQGYEYLMQRVGGSFNMTSGEQMARHNNRFSRLCEIAKDENHNITIWVIGFGVNLNAQLINCASPGDGAADAGGVSKNAFQTNSSTELENIFKSIAGKISRLRLSQ
ncbi:Flp pilus assembly protein TadG [Sphingopyxis panaciterrae]|uniref:pilus assembly protein n=1 Tax=Sphingopyxis panaciterrae TaxID=363841 RepID=UPI001FBBE3C5|nr:pilus assembly protein [Sphingopyxis panaciterrae]NIJ39055.1 Flp pilus assembly protein TadG [Sphingopyxis panaciterrae]